MNVYEVWTVWERSFGMSKKICLGIFEGESLEKALEAHASKDPDFDIHFDREELTYCGCKLTTSENS